ncbi:hypothetical protein [Vibrio japonicus]|uniref:CN hydrolase domain-containing protein n=1 Tax=Vibrio japonicus TaxID=1824638 RepID=A0ABY5LJP7_9VIBR|nr:hypothetical protein [Vibrio japonicus]UUM32279.1 hypothetical protein NP165_18520 [Vibrio japonicus]
MKIGIIQMQMSWTIEENLRTISEHVKSLDDLDVLLFPELALCGLA